MYVCVHCVRYVYVSINHILEGFDREPKIDHSVTFWSSSLHIRHEHSPHRNRSGKQTWLPLNNSLFNLKQYRMEQSLWSLPLRDWGGSGRPTRCYGAHARTVPTALRQTSCLSRSASRSYRLVARTQPFMRRVQLSSPWLSAAQDTGRWEQGRHFIKLNRWTRHCSASCFNTAERKQISQDGSRL